MNFELFREIPKLKNVYGLPQAEIFLMTYQLKTNLKSLLRIDKMLNLGNPEVKKSEKVEVK